MEDKNIIYGGDFPLELGDQTFGEYFLKKAVENGAQKPLIDGATGRFYTKEEFIRLCLQNIYVLEQLGLKHGDIISVSSENRLEYMLPVIGGICSGISTAPLNPMYTPTELVHCLKLTEPKVVFCSKFTVKLMLSVIKECKFIRKLVLFDNDFEVASPFVIRYSELLEATKNNNCDINTFKFKSVDIKETNALILYSSGTTGLPKGVMLTHYNLLVFAQVYKHPDIRNFESNDIVVSILPFFHAFGCIGLIQGMANGLQVILLAKFDFEKYLQLIEKYKATFCAVVPPVFVLFDKSPLVDRYDLSSLRVLACGAAPLSADLQNSVAKRLKVSHTRQGYGMTETTLAVTVLKYNVGKTGSTGILIPTTYAKVIDLKTGKSLGPNQEGELCFKGGVIMKGYYRDPKATSETIDADGWLHTGDIGYYDEHYYFYIVDRLKELIKCSGFQVAPAELEALLLENKEIRDVGVVGVPNERHGEVPLAFVVRQPNSKITEEQIKDFVASKLSHHKHLKGGVIFLEEIPKNPSGKILRRKLRELVKNNKSKL